MNRVCRQGYDSVVDLVMCGMMNGVQMRHHLPPGSRRDLEEYIAGCESLTCEQFYARKPAAISSSNSGATLHWASPVGTGFPQNDRAHVDLYPCKKGWSAPTVFMLHALMSVSDTGYKEWAGKFNAQGWNACFLHLPYHYSRVPRGYFNGELAIGPDLVRTSEGLRQGVMELRQLMEYLRRLGCPGFGLWATSYGAWIGALLAAVERDFFFLAIMSPIVNVDHAIWKSPASFWLRSQLRKHGIARSLVQRHYHLSSPLDGRPLADGECAIFTTGTYDLISRPKDLERIHELWHGSELLLIPQGHYGYRIMPQTFQRLIDRGLFANGQES